jgi:hypothetical protein
MSHRPWKHQTVPAALDLTLIPTRKSFIDGSLELVFGERRGVDRLVTGGAVPSRLQRKSYTDIAVSMSAFISAIIMDKTENS